MHVFRCVEYLLDNGADPCLCNCRGYSPVHYAAAYGNKRSLELVRDGHGAGHTRGGTHTGPDTRRTCTGTHTHRDTHRADTPRDTRGEHAKALTSDCWVRTRKNLFLLQLLVTSFNISGNAESGGAVSSLHLVVSPLHLAVSLHH